MTPYLIFILVVVIVIIFAMAACVIVCKKRRRARLNTTAISNYAGLNVQGTSLNIGQNTNIVH